MAIVQSLRDTNDRDGETCSSSQQIATDRSYVRPATLWPEFRNVVQIL